MNCASKGLTCSFYILITWKKKARAEKATRAPFNHLFFSAKHLKFEVSLNSIFRTFIRHRIGTKSVDIKGTGARSLNVMTIILFLVLLLLSISLLKSLSRVPFFVVAKSFLVVVPAPLNHLVSSSRDPRKASFSTACKI